MSNLKKKGRVNFLWLYLMANLSVCLSVSLFLTLSLSHMHVRARAHTHTHTHTLAGSMTPEPVWNQYGWESGKARKFQKVPESPKNYGVAKYQNFCWGVNLGAIWLNFSLRQDSCSRYFWLISLQTHVTCLS